jgi:AcrR family transcriptional regulator
MTSQEERTRATREALITAATALFAARGYADVPVGEIARKAGITTGALYHQFGSKEGLFGAVYAQMMQRTFEQVVAARKANEHASVVDDCEAFLDVAADPSGFRITADGPSVIGWDRILDRAQQMIGASLSAAYERGELSELPTPSIARMLAAALKEAGVMIATSEDPAAAREEASAGARKLISGVLSPAPAKRSRR